MTNNAFKASQLKAFISSDFKARLTEQKEKKESGSLYIGGYFDNIGEVSGFKNLAVFGENGEWEKTRFKQSISRIKGIEYISDAFSLFYTSANIFKYNKKTQKLADLTPFYFNGHENKIEILGGNDQIALTGSFLAASGSLPRLTGDSKNKIIKFLKNYTTVEPTFYECTFYLSGFGNKLKIENNNIKNGDIVVLGSANEYIGVDARSPSDAVIAINVDGDYIQLSRDGYSVLDIEGSKVNYLRNNGEGEQTISKEGSEEYYEFKINERERKITVEDHRFKEGDIVKFSTTGSLPYPLNELQNMDTTFLVAEVEAEEKGVAFSIFRLPESPLKINTPVKWDKLYHADSGSMASHNNNIYIYSGFLTEYEISNFENYTNMSLENYTLFFNSELEYKELSTEFLPSDGFYEGKKSIKKIKNSIYLYPAGVSGYKNAIAKFDEVNIYNFVAGIKNENYDKRFKDIEHFGKVGNIYYLFLKNDDTRERAIYYGEKDLIKLCEVEGSIAHVLSADKSLIVCSRSIKLDGILGSVFEIKGSEISLKGTQPTSWSRLATVSSASEFPPNETPF